MDFDLGGIVAQNSSRMNTSRRQQKREKVDATLQYAASFLCLVEERHDCEELKPRTKEKLICAQKKNWQLRSTERSGVRPQISLHEMPEEQEEDETTREMRVQGGWVRTRVARCSLGPKLMNRCRPENKDTKKLK